MQLDIHDTAIELRASGPEAARILSLFRSLADAAGLAPLDRVLAALDPEILQAVEVLEQLADGDWLYLRFGPSLVAANAEDMTGHRVGDLSPRVGKVYREALDRMAHDHRPLLAVGKTFVPGERQFWERLALPCRDADGAFRVLTYVRPHGTREDLITAVFEASQDGMLAVRAVRDRQGSIVDGRIVSANRKACEYAGYSAKDMLEASFKKLFTGLVARRIWRRCLRVIRSRGAERFELNISHHEADTWLRMTLVALGDGFVISFNDITDLKQALLEAQSSRAELAAEVEHRRALEAELRQLSLTDDLTGVSNRRAFNRRLGQEIGKARRYGGVFSIIAVDLDHFKKINDRFGHAAGDEVLMAVAAIFSDALRRDVDLVARVGGEEFMLLLPQTDLGGAGDLAERLRRRLAGMPVTLAGEKVRLSASFGVKQFDASCDPERLTIEADDALYRAKRGGRNCVVCCPSRMYTQQTHSQGSGT
jgi:diguanylate cyclase (GGDEF)-like protein/PAS domain S-box-containing protein